MTKIVLTFLLTLWVCSGQAQITQTADMETVFNLFKDANSKTLAIFDIDMVLVQPSDPAFQMPNIKRFGTLSKKILKEIPP